MVAFKKVARYYGYQPINELAIKNIYKRFRQKYTDIDLNESRMSQPPVIIILEMHLHLKGIIFYTCANYYLGHFYASKNIYITYNQFER